MPATKYYDIKNKVIAYMATVYAATDVILRQQLAMNLEMRLASEPRNLG